ncbi:group II intron maturase-specific domain-containing protein [Halocella sp. SP3-1]|uniref:group II intron maturase-specific domain-containing protein n=1 Tax=Halocella sp. SP3-1 TaxID=2382161 RepID=UPI00197AFA61|nr:group II intron maturase-specific domain-containing protein [Halocella sp. SP3-1]
MEKTNIIIFSRFKEESGSFEFLGFEFRWGKSEKFGDIIKRRISRKKLKKSIKNFTQWCKMIRNKRLKTIFKKLNSKLRGYYNYYGLINNGDSLKEFFDIAIKYCING